jgi:hypothetical protein
MGLAPRVQGSKNGLHGTKPQPYLALFDRYIARIKAAGESLTNDTQFSLIKNRVHQDFTQS